MKSLESRQRIYGFGMIAALAGAVIALGKWTEKEEKKGKALEAEWQLKYDMNGNPRPEYWGDRIQEEYKRLDKLRGK